MRRIFPILVPLTLFGCSQPFSEREGERLAQDLIRLSERGTKRVELNQFADDVCFLPEGTIYPPAAAENMFPDFRIEYVDNFGSHGVWFIVLADATSKVAKVISVKQKVLRWSVSEDAFPPVSCPSSVAITYLDGRPEIDPSAK